VAIPPDGQPEKAPDEAGDAIDQAGVDALLDAASGAADSGDSGAVREPKPEEDTSDAISQADIDILLRAVGGGEAGATASQPHASPEPDTRVDALGRPFDDAAAAMHAANEEESDDRPAATAAGQPSSASAAPPGAVPGGGPAHYALPELVMPAGLDIDPKRVSMLNDVNLRVKIELGRTRMLVEDVLALGEGSVVELDKLAGDPVDVYVNDRLVARGEVLVLNDNFCVRVSEVLSNDPHRVSA
jgi:flagellar motor switch protein FliN/FliY